MLKIMKIMSAGVVLAALVLTSQAFGATRYLKPFALAYTSQGSLEKTAQEVKAKLKQAGFEVAGEYSYKADVKIIIITSGELKKVAAANTFGAYAAAQRVAVTRHNNEVQVSYTNPEYMAYAYRLNSDLVPIYDKLKKAIGFEREYGPEEGMEPEDIVDYQYMIGMESFSDPHTLAEFGSYEEALAALEKNLSKKTGGVSKVYRVDLPNKKESVIGVAMVGQGEDANCYDDKFIMSEIDFKEIRSSAHLPYEIVVSGAKVYALSARYRIAINFPDLSMMGDNSFMNIMCSPQGIEEALTNITAK